MFGCPSVINTNLSGWCLQLLDQRCKGSINISCITGAWSLCTLCWYWKKKVKPGQQAVMSWLSCVEGGWAVWGLMLECIALGVLTCKLWNLWLSVLPSLTKQPEQSSESVRPHCSMLTFCDVSHQGHCARKTLLCVCWSAGLIFLPLVCWITVMIPRLHTACASNEHICSFACMRQIPEAAFRFYIFSKSVAQWFLSMLM